MDFVKVKVQNRIGEVYLDRPSKKNALNAQFVQELLDTINILEENDNCKIIILKSTGTVFCAGADLEYLQHLQGFTFDENLEDSSHLMQLFKKIYTSKKVIIAQIEGHAIAGGCGLATVCDFAFSVPEAKFGYTEVKIGFIPAIVMVILLRKIGEAKANELLLTGDLFTAIEASDYGFVNKVYQKEIIGEEVRKFAMNLCENTSQQSLAITKEMIGHVQGMNFNDALEYAAKQNAHSRESDDCKKGIKAFLNKEKLTW